MTESTPKLRKSRSQRKMTVWRLLGYRVAVFAGIALGEFIWRTARVRYVGEERLQASIDAHSAVVPVCWHQHLLLCAKYLLLRRVTGMRVGFLISPSLDGEAPTMLAQAYGADVIRGSGTYTGMQAIRALNKQIKQQGVSPLITPDGPRGPRFQFKGGAIAVAQLCAVPVVPLAFAARPAKVFGTWDKFVLPWPFARVVIAVGEPLLPPTKLSAEEASALRAEMAKRMHDTYEQARAALG